MSFRYSYKKKGILKMSDYTHSHEHNHDHSHSHEHTHTHSHDHGAITDTAEILALLTYMIDHNRHHTEEIHDMAHGLSGEPAELLHDAVVLFEDGTNKLDEALKLLKGE